MKLFVYDLIYETKLKCKVCLQKPAFEIEVYVTIDGKKIPKLRTFLTNFFLNN